ncbi:hypothetical protein D3C72_2442040 [compost metagenome]
MSTPVSITATTSSVEPAFCCHTRGMPILVRPHCSPTSWSLRVVAMTLRVAALAVALAAALTALRLGTEKT